MESTSTEQFYNRLDRLNIAPGWHEPERRMAFLANQFKPAIWRYRDAKAAIDEAADVVSTEEAERRNLILSNPIGDGLAPTTGSIISAYQMVGPGEKARTHRHSAAALRLVLDTEPGIYTIVNGKAIPMLPGDVLLTPGMCWHGHANEGAARAYWLDFLDVPFVLRMGAMSFEPSPLGYEGCEDKAPDSPFRIPPAKVFQPGQTGVVEIAKGVMPTIGLHLIRYDRGGGTEMAKGPIDSVYAVIGGRARFVTGQGWEASAERGDVVAMPCDNGHKIEALADDTIVLRVSDEPIFTGLGLIRAN